MSLAAFGALGLLTLLQDRLLYLPRRYPTAPEALPAPLEVLAFATADGAQRAIWLPPRTRPVSHVWFFFGGNAMVALDWVDWLADHPDTHAGFLLIDYPGYGWSVGTPSARSILAATEGAFAALATRLGEAPETLASRTCLFGHSVGAAAALQFAVRRRPVCLILTAPFTRLADVAADHFGGWVRPLVRGSYDNEARLAELEPHPPVVHVVHGDRDDIVPVAHGRALAARFPWIRYHEVRGAGHNDLLDVDRHQLHALMRDAAGA